MSARKPPPPAAPPNRFVREPLPLNVTPGVVLLLLLAMLFASAALGQTTGTLTILPSGAAGDVTAVGDCVTGACFQAVAAATFLGAPLGGGVATFRAITAADLPVELATDLELTSAIAAHAAVAAAHHTWPLTDAEIPDTITVDLAATATTALDLTCTGCVAAAEVAADVATQAEIDALRLGDLVGVTEAGAGTGEALVSAAGPTWSPVDVITEAELSSLAQLNTQIGATLADGPHTVDTDTFAGYTPTGADLGVVTGTAGGDGICAEWTAAGDLVAAASAAACGAGGGGANPAGSGSELQYRADATTFGAVTGSSVSGGAVSLGGTLSVDADGAGGYDFQARMDGSIARWEIRDRAAGANLERWQIEGGGDTNNGMLTIGLLDDAASSWTAQHALRLIVGSVNRVDVGFDLRKTGDSNTGLTWSTTDVVGLTAGGVLGLSQSATETTLLGEQVNAPTSQTCTSTGDASPGTLIVSVSGATYKAVTNSDPDGCTVILSESGATNGQRLEVVVVSSAGGSVTFADTAGVSETAGAFAAGAFDAITYRYASDRWVEISRSDN